jgi:hypothetical protein
VLRSTDLGFHLGQIERKVALAAARALEQASRLFKAIGEIPRLGLLKLLAHGKICVTELAEAECDDIDHQPAPQITSQREYHPTTAAGKHINYGLASTHHGSGVQRLGSCRRGSVYR